MLLISSMKSVYFSKCQTLNLMVSVFCWALLHFANITKPWKSSSVMVGLLRLLTRRKRGKLLSLPFWTVSSVIWPGTELKEPWNQCFFLRCFTASVLEYSSLCSLPCSEAPSTQEQFMCILKKDCFSLASTQKQCFSWKPRVRNSWNNTLSLTCGQNKCNLLKTMMS